MYSAIHDSFVSVRANTSFFTDDEGETSEENTSDENIRYFLGSGIGNRNYIGVIYIVYVTPVPEYR